MLAEESESRAQGLLSLSAILAGAVAQPWIDDDVVANRQSSDVRPNRLDDARCVGTQDPRRRDRDVGQTADDEQVEPIERDGMDANPHVARPRQLGHREIFAKLDAIESAVTGDRERLHEIPANALILAVREVSVTGGKAEQTLSQSV